MTDEPRNLGTPNVESPHDMTDFAERYRGMSDDELHLLVQDIDELTPAAREALQAELVKRGIPLPPVAEGEWDSERPVVIGRFLNLHEALLAKGPLDSAGIATTLLDDNMVRIDWFISNLLGGVKLAVSPADADSAREILAQPIPEDFDVEGVGEYQQPRCPKCNSLDISYESLDKPVSYGSTMLLGVPLPVAANRWRCHNCNARWEGKDDHNGGV